MRSIVLCLAGGIMSLLTGPASADILFEIDTDVQVRFGSRSLTPITQFNPGLWYESGPSGTLMARIFAGLIVDMGDVGTTFVATPQNDPGFAQFASLLTDGNEQWLFMTSGAPGGAGGTSECNQFYLDHTCTMGVDLKGNEIERVTFTQKAWYNVSPGSDPGGDGIWTDVYGAYRITIEGHAIPEPGTAALVAIGLLGVGVSRAGRRTRQGWGRRVPLLTR